jgi:hypothetical protein
VWLQVAQCCRHCTNSRLLAHQLSPAIHNNRATVHIVWELTNPRLLVTGSTLSHTVFLLLCCFGLLWKWCDSGWYGYGGSTPVHLLHLLTRADRRFNPVVCHLCLRHFFSLLGMKLGGAHYCHPLPHPRLLVTGSTPSHTVFLLLCCFRCCGSGATVAGMGMEMAHWCSYLSCSRELVAGSTQSYAIFVFVMFFLWPGLKLGVAHYCHPLPHPRLLVTGSTPSHTIIEWCIFSLSAWPEAECGTLP